MLKIFELISYENDLYHVMIIVKNTFYLANIVYVISTIPDEALAANANIASAVMISL